jgi:gluconate kinase
MKLIFIWGSAASGKLTVAQALAAQTGIALFHNHLVVDALLEKFEFGEPEFVRLREAMWMTVFDTAAKSGQSLIFTFAPEPTVERGFAERVKAVIEAHEGEVRFVRLLVSRETQEGRIANESRQAFRKLVSLDMLRELRAGFEDSEAEMPAADLVIDTELDEPHAAAWQIADAFGLGMVES